jgi:hypothetical protein
MVIILSSGLFPSRRCRNCLTTGYGLGILLEEADEIEQQVKNSRETLVLMKCDLELLFTLPQVGNLKSHDLSGQDAW